MITRNFGMDIHQVFAMIVAVDNRQQIVYPVRKVRMVDLESWAAQELTASDAVVIEVTTNAWHVVDVLGAYAGQVAVVNPYKTRLIAAAQIKNDKVDALALAKLLAAGFICEVWVPSAEVRQWRILAEHRATLSKQCTEVKNRLHSMRHRHNWEHPTNDLFSQAGRQWLAQQAWPAVEALTVQQDLAQLALLESQLKAADQLIARLATQDPRVARLMQISGIGLYTAFTFLAIIGDIDRFPTASHLSGYVGLVPRQQQSGQRGYFGHITKSGSPLLRWLMVEAAQAAVRWDPHWREVHSRIAHRRGSGIATVAVARKLLVVMWHMLSFHTCYQHLRHQSYVTKLQNWAYAVGRQHLPAPSSKVFVTNLLSDLDMAALAAQIFSQKKSGRLLISASPS
jgi:transposase